MGDSTASTPLHYACLYPMAQDKYHQINSSIPEAGFSHTAPHTDRHTHIVLVRRLCSPPPCRVFPRRDAPGGSYYARESKADVLKLLGSRSKEITTALIVQDGTDEKDGDKGRASNGSSGEFPGGEMVELFLNRGADVNLQCDGGSYPLHYAATSGNKAACQLLLRAGARINAVDYEGTTVSMLSLPFPSSLLFCFRPHLSSLARTTLRRSTGQRPRAPNALSSCSSTRPLPPSVTSTVSRRSITPHRPLT